MKVVINAIQTEKEFFIQREGNAYSNMPINQLFFDGVSATSTFHANWFKISSTPKRVHTLVNQPRINYRLELIDKSLESDRFPASFSIDEVMEHGDEWKSEYQHLSSLYGEVSDVQPPLEEDVEFEFKVILAVSNIQEYADFAYVADNSAYHKDPKLRVTARSMTHQVIDKILFPDLLLPSQPCSLSSKETYGIVREYIKNNINPKAAEITSDYEFCFTVKKKIPLATPYQNSYETKKNNGKSYRPPRINNHLVKSKGVEVFEMTHDKRNYANYTPIVGFCGDNQEDLKNNIDKYLEELINYINVPLVECQHCNGVGVVDNP